MWKQITDAANACYAMISHHPEISVAVGIFSDPRMNLVVVS